MRAACGLPDRCARTAARTVFGRTERSCGTVHNKYHASGSKAGRVSDDLHREDAWHSLLLWAIRLGHDRSRDLLQTKNLQDEKQAVRVQ